MKLQLLWCHEESKIALWEQVQREPHPSKCKAMFSGAEASAEPVPFPRSFRISTLPAIQIPTRFVFLASGDSVTLPYYRPLLRSITFLKERTLLPKIKDPRWAGGSKN